MKLFLLWLVIDFEFIVILNEKNKLILDWYVKTQNVALYLYIASVFFELY